MVRRNLFYLNKRFPIGSMLIIIIAVSILFNCDFKTVQEPQSSEGILSLSFISNKSLRKTIEPDIDMQITKYSISGEGPSGESFTKVAVSPGAIYQASLTPGNWHVSVTGNNRDDIAIEGGATDVMIVPGEVANSSITLTPLTGNGFLSLNVSWPGNPFSNPSVTGTITPIGGTAQPISLTISGDNESASYGDSLNAGYYKVALQLRDNDQVKWGRNEAALVVKGKNSSQSYTITDSPPLPDGNKLSVHPDNPHYLWNGNETILLIGGGTTVHPSSNNQIATDKSNIDTWSNLGANYARIWTVLPWEGTEAVFPWKRTGPGTANDGGLKFDLTQFNPVFFERMNELLSYNSDFYLQYMLFDEVGLEHSSARWDLNPYNPDNNINNLGLPPTGNDAVPEFYNVADTDLLHIQELYVQKVIDELDHNPNIIYEIANETTAPWDWQEYWIDFISERSVTPVANNPFSHRSENLNDENLDIVNYHNLVAGETNATFTDDYNSNKILKFDEQVYNSPTATQIRQVAWESFTGGGHINWDESGNESVAATTSQYLSAFISGNNIDPATMAPHNELVNRGYALADPGNEYIVFLHSESNISINLSLADGLSLQSVWYNTVTGNYSQWAAITGSQSVTITNPFDTDVVLYIKR